MGPLDNVRKTWRLPNKMQHAWQLTDPNDWATHLRRGNGLREITPAVWLGPEGRGGKLQLRPMVWQDGPIFNALRLENERFLRPVEPTAYPNWTAAHTQDTWRDYMSNIKRAGEEGTATFFAILLNDEFVGQVTIGNITGGAAMLGYWVDHKLHGRGIATAACALGSQHAFDRMFLRRVVATYLPENLGSARVLEKNRYQVEGMQRRSIEIDGVWRDHVQVSLLVDDFPDLPVAHLVAQGLIRPSVEDRELFLPRGR